MDTCQVSLPHAAAGTCGSDLCLGQRSLPKSCSSCLNFECRAKEVGKVLWQSLGQGGGWEGGFSSPFPDSHQLPSASIFTRGSASPKV